MKWDPRMVVALGAFALTAGLLALGGTIYNIVCTDPGCGYKTDLGLGGAKLRVVKAGWCVHCGEFVSIGWTRPGAPALPGLERTPEVKPVGTIWLPMTGQVKAAIPQWGEGEWALVLC